MKGARILKTVQIVRSPPLVPSLPFLFLFPLEGGGDMEEKGEGRGENGRPDLLTGVPSAKTSLDLLFPFMTLSQYEPSF